MSNIIRGLELPRRLELALRELGLLVVSDARRLLGGALGFPATELYVANYDTDPNRAAILVFEAGATGNSPPIHVIQPPADLVPTDVAVDDYGDVYLADAGKSALHGGSVAVFARGSAGPTPLRHIRGPATTLVQPVAVALDSARRVHVADAGRPGQLGGVVVFAPDADGDVTPVARVPAVDPTNPVQKAKTGLAAPRGVAVDASGRIYVSGNYGEVLRFRALGGDEAPEAVLSDGSSYRGLAASRSFRWARPRAQVH